MKATEGFDGTIVILVSLRQSSTALLLPEGGGFWKVSGNAALLKEGTGHGFRA